MNEARIVANLQKVQNVKTQAQLLVGEGLPNDNKARSRHVTITDDRACGICYKRLGGSVISVFPEYVLPITGTTKIIADIDIVIPSFISGARIE